MTVIEQRCPVETVFQLPSVDFVKDNDFYRVVALKSIKKDSILLIEHVFSSDKRPHVLEAIASSSTLFNNYYPRNGVAWDFETDHHDAVIEKYNSNIFNTDGIYQACLLINSFNHSKNHWNADVFDTQFKLKNDSITYFKAIIASKDIDAGNEIFIRYNEFLNDDCIIPTNDDLQTCLKNYPIISSKFSQSVKDKVRLLISLYTKKNTFREIVLCHILLKLGYNHICSTPIVHKRLNFFENIGIRETTTDKESSILFSKYLKTLYDSLF
jgi:hypothetical protein